MAISLKSDISLNNSNTYSFKIYLTYIVIRKIQLTFLFIYLLILLNKTEKNQKPLVMI